MQYLYLFLIPTNLPSPHLIYLCLPLLLPSTSTGLRPRNRTVRPPSLPPPSLSSPYPRPDFLFITIYEETPDFPHPSTHSSLSFPPQKKRNRKRKRRKKIIIT